MIRKVKKLQAVINNNFKNGFIISTLVFQNRNSGEINEFMSKLKDYKQDIKYVHSLENPIAEKVHCHILTEQKYKDLIETNCKEKEIMLIQSKERKIATKKLCEYLLKGATCTLTKNMYR